MSITRQEKCENEGYAQGCIENKKRIAALEQQMKILEQALIISQQQTLSLGAQVKQLQDSVELLLKKLGC